VKLTVRLTTAEVTKVLEEHLRIVHKVAINEKTVSISEDGFSAEGEPYVPPVSHNYR
jgi:hypothetical protein